jgi:hypothetical protein
MPKSIAAALLLALAGCSYGPSPRVTVIDIDSGYSLMEFTAARAGGVMPTLIHGNVFTLDQAVFDQIVTGSMRGHHFGPPTDFVPIAPVPQPTYRVVMAFNGTPLTGTQLCQGAQPQQLFGGPPGAIRINAAFCRGGRDLTEVEGGVTDVFSPDDPRFRALVAQTTFQLFPPNLYEYDRGGSFRF